MIYTGRFAPSPTGPLHFGSLLAALASYLDAKHRRGRWLVRIENLDPPREVPGAADSILSTLDQYGLHWDGQIEYQIERQDFYHSLLNDLKANQLAYPCHCSRSQLKQRHALRVYDQQCWFYPPDVNLSCAFRARRTTRDLHFHDRILGFQQLNPNTLGDFVVYRRDQLFAYQLAVVADDMAQGVNHIVRGSDLLQETFAQLQLQQHLGFATPEYAHIPIAVNAQGQKLSKQNLATSIEQQPIIKTLIKALTFLQQPLPPEPFEHTTETLLHWSTKHWCIDQIPKTLTLQVAD